MTTKTKNDRTVPVKEWASGSGDEKKLRDMMGLSDDAPIASDATGERTMPDEASAHTPHERGNGTTGFTTAAPITTDDPDVVTASGEYDGAASSAPDGGGVIPGRTIIHIADGEAAERSEDTVPTESETQTLPNGDDRFSVHTLPTPPSDQLVPSACGEETRPITDGDPIRRTVKQRKSDLNEYRATFLTMPRIKDRKPVFVSGEVRDKLDRIVRLLGERGMNVSGLIENIALHHLAVHEADIEHWRKM